MEVRKATECDVPAILTVLSANAEDKSLFQQAEHQVRKTLGDFFVAVGDAGAVVGCAALHWHGARNAEILAVAVAPSVQRGGVGKALMVACISEATNNTGAVP